MIDSKKLVLFDSNEGRDHASFKAAEVTIRDHETGEILLKKKPNKVLISGAAFTAAKHFNIKPKALTTTYNTVLNLENSVYENYDGEGIRKEEQIFLFAIGIGGCGQENSQVFEVDYTKWISPENLVPFRYQLKTDDLGAHMRTKYFGRKEIGDRIAYYFKGFENPPEFKQQFIDGTPIDENIYINNRIEEAESYVELKLQVTKDDARDFFKATTGIADARINTISLLTAWAKEIDGYTYYQDIRPLTKLNFPNESLIDLSKGIDITYDIFY